VEGSAVPFSPQRSSAVRRLQSCHRTIEQLDSAVPAGLHVAPAYPALRAGLLSTVRLRRTSPWIRRLIRDAGPMMFRCAPLQNGFPQGRREVARTSVLGTHWTQIKRVPAGTAERPTPSETRQGSTYFAALTTMLACSSPESSLCTKAFTSARRLALSLPVAGPE